jgi:hypothetical protein
VVERTVPQTLVARWLAVMADCWDCPPTAAEEAFAEDTGMEPPKKKQKV